MESFSRRSFLRGILTVAALTAVPIGSKLFAAVPRIVGDGVHDDYPGLQALFDNQPFTCETDLVSSNAGDIAIRGGKFLLSDTVRMRSDRSITLDGGVYIAAGKDMTTGLRFDKCDTLLVHDIVLRRPQNLSPLDSMLYFGGAKEATIRGSCFYNGGPDLPQLPSIGFRFDPVTSAVDF